MCTRLYLDQERKELRQLVELSQNKEAEDLLRWGDARPTDTMPILVEEGFHTEAVLGTWGYPNECGQTTYVNARVETVTVQRGFSADFLTRRCVIPVCGYYGQSFSKKAGDSLFFDRDGGLLYLAGIWKKDFRGNYRFVVLTAKADGSTSPLAPRMPLLMDSSFVKTWLSDAKKAEEYLHTKMHCPAYLELSRISA